jgi:predicted O-linked N-acetylglucosamine transferase (SPINDLY family)
VALGRRASTEAQLAAAVARHRAGDLKTAISGYRAVMAASRDNADVLELLGVALGARGDVSAAERLLRKSLRVRPLSASAWSNLGALLLRAGRLGECIEVLQSALTLAPEDADANANLAGAFAASGRFEAAERAARRALMHDASHPAGLGNLGAALLGLGRVAEARTVLEQATVGPCSSVVWSNLGQVKLRVDDIAGAEAAFKAALQRDPSNFDAHKGLGLLLARSRRLSEAEPLLERCAAQLAAPDVVHFALGHLRVLAGREDEGMTWLRQGALRPDAPPQEASTLLFDLNYVPGLSSAELLGAHQQWDRRFAQPLALPAPAFPNEPRPDRRLRIGFVSPDLRAHSVSFFLTPLLRGLNRAEVEVLAYANLAKPDAVTASLRPLFSEWRDVWSLGDEALVTLIRADRIDILIDLAGHTADHRLLVFARRPAPIQVSYLGYPATTGLTAMDARIVDQWTDPAGSQSAASERLCALDRCFLAYEPGIFPPVAPSPVQRKGRVTFGSFNNIAKLNPDILGIWARLLAQVPGARLLLKHDVSADEGVRSSIRARLAALGVDAARVDFLPRSPDLLSHLEAYAEIDVALDTAPYNGTTTTCEALWMGIPVVTLTGDRHAGRVGTSLLTSLGLHSCIAASPEEYVLTAAQLAASPELLAAMRQMLRPEMSRSELCDGHGLGRAFVTALRQLWTEWCETGAVSRPIGPDDQGELERDRSASTRPEESPAADSRLPASAYARSSYSRRDPGSTDLPLQGASTR